MSHLLETIKIKNGNIYHLDLHQQRMDKSCMDNFHIKAPDLKSILKSMHIPADGWYKCKIIYKERILKCELLPYHPKKIQTLQLVHADIDYTYKWENRNSIIQLQSENDKADDIIIVRNNELTDASYANLLFFDGKDWITPDRPLLKGIQRHYLLKEKIIIEKPVFTHDLKKYRKLALVNAMLDFEDKIEVEINNVLI